MTEYEEFFGKLTLGEGTAAIAVRIDDTVKDCPIAVCERQATKALYRHGVGVVEEAPIFRDGDATVHTWHGIVTPGGKFLVEQVETLNRCFGEIAEIEAKQRAELEEMKG